MKIIVMGMGYVGLSNAVLLAQTNEVIGLEIDQKKVDLINNKKSPLKDDYLIDYLANKELNLIAKTSGEEDFKDANLAILALPTNYDEVEKFFDTSFLDDAIKMIKSIRKDLPILIKSTIPIGYTDGKNKEFNCDNIIFSPEFLREGRALYDSLHPSRIIVSDKTEIGEKIAGLYKNEALNNPDVILMGRSEAEAVKLFANTYLAMRVSFFNELDNYAIAKGLDSKSIIEGVSADPRIGDHYNNPSFGYGGYCLPKDSKQLYANYENIPSALFKSIIDSNEVRKDFVSEDILAKNPQTIGVYRLVMKKGSDNFRKSAIFDVINNLKSKGANLVIYEPNLDGDDFEGMKLVRNLDDFKKVDLIIANRVEDDLKDVKNKLYTRDLFERD
ncbi:nucleotide sugar dehydrogenase [Anaerococcus lactolyticus ATCC 51172]|uniref:UDP-glucose 6-dehydrogenase n=1 Tax=Anaerococcus lactolyticus ATCC 51172 TaxID=525254 RepID=C2BHF4_9FIRM|nr:nucleotide sugar dehydrogenase [Anaerococcus lactolyticus]EEI85567.1 nucleotide sugar dehydrogenase [Anaerococcus lactolyticus ATCC 51172]